MTLPQISFYLVEDTLPIITTTTFLNALTKVTLTLVLL